MLRVMFVHRDLRASGGVPNCILNFARHRRRETVDVRVGCFEPPPATMRRALAAVGARIRHLGDSGYIAPAYRLRRYIISAGVDVVVCCSFKSYIVGKLACIGTSCRSVFWVHAIPLVITGPVRRGIVSWLSRNDTMVFVSEACRTAHLPTSHQGISAVVYNGVPDWKDDPDRHRPYPPGERPLFGIPADALVLCYIAEMIGWKDHLTLLDAFARVSQKRPDAHLLLVGTGDLSERLRHAAEETDCAEQVHFLGLRTDARRILGLADLYVHPSRGEGFGLAVVEAMLAERPVIAARDGAMIEYLSEGDNGLLFEPGDGADFAEKILSIAAQPEEARRMGERARGFALEKFSPARFVDTLGAVLSDEGEPLRASSLQIAGGGEIETD